MPFICLTQSSYAYQSSWQAGDRFGSGGSDRSKEAAGAASGSSQLTYEASGYPSSYSSLSLHGSDERPSKRQAVGASPLCYSSEQQRLSGRLLQVLNAMAGSGTGSSSICRRMEASRRQCVCLSFANIFARDYASTWLQAPQQRGRCDRRDGDGAGRQPRTVGCGAQVSWLGFHDQEQAWQRCERKKTATEHTTQCDSLTVPACSASLSVQERRRAAGSVWAGACVC